MKDQKRFRFIFIFIFIFLAISACDAPLVDVGNADSDTDTDTNTDTEMLADTVSDLNTDEVCQSGIMCSHDSLCCKIGEECVDDFQCLPVCNNIRCGSNNEECCNAGEICLDGVKCTPDCSGKGPMCGENSDVCCESGDFCLNNKCIQPSVECNNDFDCPDESFYCDDVVSLCLPLPEGPLCEGQAQFNAIEPIVEWKWDGEGLTYKNVKYNSIMSSPMVGDVTGDKVPDIVVVVYPGKAYQGPAMIAVFNGAGDGNGGHKLHFTIPSENDPTAPYADAFTSVALANFDDDPGLEIVYGMYGGGVRIADNNGIGGVCNKTKNPDCKGIRKTGYGAGTFNNAGITVSDVDADGMPDVIVRCQAMNGHDISDANLDFANIPGCYGQSSKWANNPVADLNGNGKVEIVDAQKVIEIDPTLPEKHKILWEKYDRHTGFLAVADILPSVPGPEIVNIAGGLYIIDHKTGDILVGYRGTIVNINLAVGGRGGAPNIGDFDGDGYPEIATAGGANYMIFDVDCYSDENGKIREGKCETGTNNFILWQKPTQDVSSMATGSSIFDFQGDGAAEAVYNDECYLRIYDGKTGEELSKIENRSYTLFEYPVVADVDGDGNSEILVVSNISPMGCPYADQTAGMKVLGDVNDRWVRTRNIWPQYNYHLTDYVLKDGAWNVPKAEEPNWLPHNNYRQNAQGGVKFPVGDLSLELTAVPKCDREILLTVVVKNAGSAGVKSGQVLSFYKIADGKEELVAQKETTKDLMPGEYERITVSYPDPEPNKILKFIVKIDEEGLIEECNEDNNVSNSEVEVSCIAPI